MRLAPIVHAVAVLPLILRLALGADDAPVQSNCAVSSIEALCDYLGKPLAAADAVRLSREWSGRSMAMADIAKVGRRFGIELHGYRCTLGELRSEGRPAIMHLSNPDHYWVFVGATKEAAQIVDGGQAVVLRLRDVERRFSGRALMTTASQVEGPRIEVDGVDHFATASGPEEPIIHSYRYRNSGQKPLTIDVDWTSCNCTVAEGGSRILAPGQSASLSVRTSAGEGGPLMRSLMLRTNDPDRPRVLLTLRSAVQWPVSVIPQEVAMRARYGRAVDAHVSVTGDQTMDVRGAALAMPFLLARVTPVQPHGLGSRAWQVTVTCASTSPIGRFEDTLVIETTSPSRPKITIPIRGRVDGDLNVRPSKAFLGFMKVGSTASVKVTVRSESGRAFRISKTRASSSTIQVSVDAPPEAKPTDAAPAHTLKIEVTAAESGPIAGEVELTTDVPGQERITIPLSGLAE